MSLNDSRPLGRPDRGPEAFHSAVQAVDYYIRRLVLTPGNVTILVSLFTMALILRIAYAVVAVQVDPMLNGDPLMGDAASYDRIARSLAAGTGFSEAPPTPTAFWPPLYPMFLGAVYWLFGHELMISRVINAILGALVPIVIYLIGIRLFDRRVALLAAVGSVFYPLLIVLGAWVIPDGPYVLLVCLIVLAMIDIQRKPRFPGYVLLGVLLGLAFLLKPVTAFFLPALVPWFLVSLPQPEIRPRLVAGIITALVLIVVLAPWTVRNQVAMGSPIIGSTNGGYTFYGANNPHAFGGHYEHFPERIEGLSESAEQREFYRRGIEWIRNNPSDFLRVEVQKFKRLASPLSISSSPEDLSVTGEGLIRIMYTAFLLAALSGLVLTAGNWRITGVLVIPVIAVLLSTAVFYGDARYTMPMVPTLLIWASVACIASWDAIVRRTAPAD